MKAYSNVPTFNTIEDATGSNSSSSSSSNTVGVSSNSSIGILKDGFIDWDAALASLEIDRTVQPVTWLKPGMNLYLLFGRFIL